MDKYFKEHVDYPKINDIANILEFNTVYNYISSSFLNAFINPALNGELVKAYLLGRYHGENEYCNNDTYYQEPVNSLNWKLIPERCISKKELFKLVTETGRLKHTKLDMFRDDIALIIKSKLEDGTEYYWYFWFDMDCSDCSIGRFITTDSTEEVLKHFEAEVKQISELHEPWELPRHFFEGLVSF